MGRRDLGCASHDFFRVGGYDVGNDDTVSSVFTDPELALVGRGRCLK
jgi:hypothetical protein